MTEPQLRVAPKLRVAFVVQRCGREVIGGAELLCLQVAQRMAKHWKTEVLTTCALDYMTWENHYQPGCESIGDTVVRRFFVDQPRDVDAFNRLSADLHSRQDATSLAEQESWMRSQGPISTTLYQYLTTELDRYDAFIFFGYLYATTYFGLPLVREKAYLAPLAHDEWPIYFSMWERIFSLPKHLIFNTPWERKFLETRFRELRAEGTTIGVGIEPPQSARPDVFRRRYDIAGNFLLYVGRVDESKGCQTLIEYFIRGREEQAIDHKLVLIGEEVMLVPYHPDIIYLGFVTDEEKFNAMAACDWLVNPSPYESLSLVLLENWFAGRPALVNASSEVLVGHCRKSNGGLWYSSYGEWLKAITAVDSATKSILGQQGKAYVQANYTWERVESKYKATLERSIARAPLNRALNRIGSMKAG
jgi:glycosyltransferase involved in cell wall biosynthesis